jgi:MATE family multidrug resistance protein
VVFAWFGHSQRLIELETVNAQILIAGAFFMLATRGIAQYFYGMHRPVVVLIAAIAGNIANAVFNYALIFGNWGAPEMGVAGSAIATVLGSAVELSIPLAVFLGRTWNERYGTRASWRPSLSHLRDIWKIGWPGALMFGNEMICWGYFTLYLVAHFGEEHNTGSWIALRYMHLSFMPAVGISFAMTAIVGRYLGMRRPDLAWSRARLGVGLTVCYMGLCAVAFVLFRHPMAEVFSDEPRVVEIGARIILLAAVFQLFDALGITIIGVLRGAGDTIWPGVVTVVLSWTCLVGLGHVMVAVFPELTSVGPWIGSAVYIILLGIFLGARFVWGKWRAMKLIDATIAP